jgi:hypothetical protein
MGGGSAKAELALHPDKTRIVDATQRGGFEFLGYHVERGMQWPGAKSLEKLKTTVRAHTRRRNRNSLPTIISQLNRSLTGWIQIFSAQSQDYVPLTRQLDTNAFTFHSALSAGKELSWRRRL